MAAVCKVGSNKVLDGQRLANRGHSTLEKEYRQPRSSNPATSARFNCVADFFDRIAALFGSGVNGIDHGGFTTSGAEKIPKRLGGAFARQQIVRIEVDRKSF
jgi:hypothetical protein